MNFLNSSLDNEALEAQIREAKLKAATFSKSLQEAREQEAIALQALEEEREKWSNNYEKKTILIDQLERELTSTVEALDSERTRTKSFEVLASNLQTSLENERHAHDITRLSSPPRMTRAPEPRQPPVEAKTDNVDVKVWNDMLSQYNQQLRVTTDQLAAVSREKEVLQIHVNNLKKEKEQSSVALKDVQGKLDFRTQQVLELEDEKMHFEKRMAALKLQIDTQYIQLGESNIKLTTFQRDAAEVPALKEKNQTLERRIADMLAEDSSARLRQELEEAKRIAASLQIQVKDLERTVDEWVRRTASAEEKLSEAQHRLIDERSARTAAVLSTNHGGVIPAGPSDSQAGGSREEWMHRAIVAERRLEHIERFGPPRPPHPEAINHSSAGSGSRHADQGETGASIKAAMNELAHLEVQHANAKVHYQSQAAGQNDHHAANHHSSHHSGAKNVDHDHHHGHERGHSHLDSVKESNHEHDRHAHHHQQHSHGQGESRNEQRGSSKSREHSTDNRSMDHTQTPDSTGLSLNVVHSEASTMDMGATAVTRSLHNEHHVVPLSAKSTGTLGTVETVSNPSTLRTRSLSPHRPATSQQLQHQPHLPPKHPFSSPAVVTYTSDVIFDQPVEEADVDHQSEVSELSVLYGRAPTPLDENWEVVEHSQADYPSVTSDILGHAHDGKHYEMRPKLRKQQKNSGKTGSSAPNGAVSVRRSAESLVSAKSAKSVGSTNSSAKAATATASTNKAATPSSGKKSVSASSQVSRHNEVTKYKQQDSNVVTLNPKMKDHPAVNSSAVSGTSAGFSVLDLVSSSSVAANRPVTPSSGAKVGKVTSSKATGSSNSGGGVKIVSKAAVSAPTTPAASTKETLRSASAPKSRPSSATAAATPSSGKPPLPSQTPVRKASLPTRSSTPQGQRATTPSSEKRQLKVVMPTAPKSS